MTDGLTEGTRSIVEPEPFPSIVLLETPLTVLPATDVLIVDPSIASETIPVLPDKPLRDASATALFLHVGVELSLPLVRLGHG